MERFDPKAVQKHFDGIASTYDEGKARRSYYWRSLVGIYREFVAPGASVLDVGCGTGNLLASLSPSRGAGIDLSPAMIERARAKYPQYEFWAEDISRPTRREAFGNVLLCDVVEHLPDLTAALKGLKSYADKDTRLVATAINPLWAGVLHAAEALGLKLPEGDHEWITLRKLRGLLEEQGYRVESEEGRLLLPLGIPLAAGLFNRLARLRVLRPLCLVYVVVFRLKG